MPVNYLIDGVFPSGAWVVAGQEAVKIPPAPYRGYHQITMETKATLRFEPDPCAEEFTLFSVTVKGESERRTPADTMRLLNDAQRAILLEYSAYGAIDIADLASMPIEQLRQCLDADIQWRKDRPDQYAAEIARLRKIASKGSPGRWAGLQGLPPSPKAPAYNQAEPKPRKYDLDM